jgi:transposase-like protein
LDAATITWTAMLMVPEMEEHLGYEKHAKSVVKNSRNGRTSKRIKTEDG